MQSKPKFIVFVLMLLSLINCQPFQNQVSGQTNSNQCTYNGQCTFDGSSNYAFRSLKYDTEEGKFNGYLITNQCSNKKYAQFGGVQTNIQKSNSKCVKQELPAPTYIQSNLPKAAPLR